MSNVIEFETDRKLSSAEMLTKLARQAEEGEITNVIIIGEHPKTKKCRIYVAESQSERDLFWQLYLGAHAIMDA